MSQPRTKTHFGEGKRFGNHSTKTRAKTARACGSNYTPTGSWRDRNQGIAGAKSSKTKADITMMKKARQMARGDVKEATA